MTHVLGTQVSTKAIISMGHTIIFIQGLVGHTLKPPTGLWSCFGHTFEPCPGLKYVLDISYSIHQFLCHIWGLSLPSNVVCALGDTNQSNPIISLVRCRKGLRNLLDHLPFMRDILRSHKTLNSDVIYHIVCTRAMA